ncbi:hypothetical protein GCM10027612_31620 [Microbispora bryophytorum subsp. camponoti]
MNWLDPRVDWSEFDAAVVRSPWDYIDRRDEFVAWAHRVESVTRLFNPAPVIEWNTDKTYLRTLGVPTVPTHWPTQGGDPGADLPDWDEFVVKPAISAGARDTVRTADRGAAAGHAATLLAAGRTVMVQPYIPSVEQEGSCRCCISAAGSATPYGGTRCSPVWRRPRRTAPRCATRTTTSSPSPSGSWPPCRRTCCTPGWTWCGCRTASRS